jgi:hypothetical protein
MKNRSLYGVKCASICPMKQDGTVERVPFFWDFRSHADTVSHSMVHQSELNWRISTYRQINPMMVIPENVLINGSDQI